MFIRFYLGLDFRKSLAKGGWEVMGGGAGGAEKI